MYAPIESGMTISSERTPSGTIHQSRLWRRLRRVPLPPSLGARVMDTRRLRLRRYGRRPVELLRHPVVDAPLPVAPLHDFGVGAHGRIAGAGLREEEDLQVDVVLVGVLDVAPLSEPTVGCRIGNDWDVP